MDEWYIDVQPRAANKIGTRLQHGIDGASGGGQRETYIHVALQHSVIRRHTRDGAHFFLEKKQISK